MDSCIFYGLFNLVPANKKSKNFGPPPKLSAKDMVVTRGKKKVNVLEGSIDSHDVLDSVAKRLHGKKRFVTIQEGSLHDLCSPSHIRPVYPYRPSRNTAVKPYFAGSDVL